MATLDNRFDKKPKEPEVTPTESKPKGGAFSGGAADVYKTAKELGLYDTIDKRDFGIINANPQYGWDLLQGKLEYNDPVTTPERQAKLAEDWETRRQTELNAMKVGPKNASTGGAIGGKKNWQSVIDTMFTSIANDKFKYDPKSDPRYALAEEYAENAMKNQMAESALLSGGYGNSYAAATGQGVYNDYMQSAEANLEADAYNRYIDQRNHKLDMLSIANQFEERDYNRAYQKERDRIADERYETETAKADERYESQTAWNQALVAAEMGDFEGLKKFNIDTTDEEAVHAIGMFGQSGDISYLNGVNISDEAKNNIVNRYKASLFAEGFSFAYEYYKATGNTDKLEALGVDVTKLLENEAAAKRTAEIEEAVFLAVQTGNFGELEALGFSSDYLRKLQNAQFISRSSGGGYGSNGSGIGNLTLAQALTEARNGHYSEIGRALVDANFGEGYYQREYFPNPLQQLFHVFGDIFG